MKRPRQISPFGGLASFISFLGQIGFARQVQQHLPFAESTANNAIPLAHSLSGRLNNEIFWIAGWDLNRLLGREWPNCARMS
jgi:hypothetical protein